MKRFFRLALLSVITLDGCGRAPDVKTADVTTDAAADAKPVIPVSSSPLVNFTPDRKDLIAPGEVPLLEQIDRETTRVVNAAMPSIVRITATRSVDPRLLLFGNTVIPFQLPFGKNKHRYVPPSDTAFGSGVIISKDGYILTNNHVIEDSNDLEVQLEDKETFSARLVAADELVDLAILKIDAHGLAPLPWGNSDRVQVGEQVFAIGNPFDLDDSVSKGIVSAKGRNLPESEADSPHYEDYIQTDAAINPGNSGGALINIHGELIGLNAAIASTSRVNMGIGFAIPSNLARYAVEGLLRQGHLIRGYLGVILPDSIDDDVIQKLNLKSSEGALLAGIQSDSPAERAKLHVWDFITGVDGHKIDSEAELRLIVAQLPIGKQVQVNFLREGKPQTTTVRIALPPQDQTVSADPADNTPEYPQAAAGVKGPAQNVLNGLQVVDLNDRSRQKFGVAAVVSSGVIVSGVQEGSQADAKGIARGDVIESASIDQGSTQNLATAKDFADLNSTLKPDKGIVLLVHDRDKGYSFVYLPAAK